MDKWAHYFISEVSYDSDHLISVAIRHQDTDQGITRGKPIDRLTISSDIINGLFYITIYSGNDSWKKGHKIQTFSIGGAPYLRIDGNKVKLDYLGDLPKASIVIPESVKELEVQPEPITEPEPTPSPRGSLPKESTEELPQELDLTPEPITEPKEEEATPEQLAQLKQLEQLEKEIKKFELQQQLITEPEPTPSPRGSLPKESTEELPQELDLTPEPITEPEEEEATPEQLAQLDDLQQQIDELEYVLSSHTLSESQPEEEEATPEQLAQLDDLQQQIDELEDEISTKLNSSSNKLTTKQFSKVKQLEKEIKKPESTDIERKIIKTLRKQNKKLDAIEKKLHRSTTTKKSTLESNFSQAYCVKCKTKRKIENPKETTMKNGRAAVKGFCSVCHCKVFRIGKIKK